MNVIKTLPYTYIATVGDDTVGIYSSNIRLDLRNSQLLASWQATGVDSIHFVTTDTSDLVWSKGDPKIELRAAVRSTATTPLPVIPFRAGTTAFNVVSVLQDVEAKLDSILYGAEIVIVLAAIRSSAEANVREIVQPDLLRYGAGELSIEELSWKVHSARNTPFSTKEE